MAFLTLLEQRVLGYVHIRKGTIKSTTHLELVFVTTQRGALLLPEVVWLNDIGNVDGAGEMLLQYLQDRLHGAPGGPSHVDDHREPLLSHFVTANK